ncbi:MAG TPA: hypothetical protein VGL36_35635 [Kribbella sp.]
MHDQTLPGAEAARVVYQMQAWRASNACTCGLTRGYDRHAHKPACPYPAATRSWVPMEDGPAAAHWKPKRDARAAVAQAARWTGAIHGVGIPAMQVVELHTGRVIWRDSYQYPAAGDPIVPDWQPEVYAAGRAEHAADHGIDEPGTGPIAIQGTLF